MTQKILFNSTFSIMVGPFLDATDGVSEEVALNHTTLALFLNKHDSTVWANGAGTSMVHSSNGWYEYKGVAADADTLGRLRLKVSDSAVHLPVWQDYEVVSSQFYLSMYSTIPMPVDVNRWNTTAVVAATFNTSGEVGVSDIQDGAISSATFGASAIDDRALASAATTYISSKVWAEAVKELSSVTVNAFAANAITSAAFAASAIDDRAISAAATSEIGRAVWNSSITEPSSGPFEWGTSGNYGVVMEWMGALSRNQIDQSSVDQILRADSTATIISSARTSGSSTIFVRGEWTS
jgi:hypothetical protein